MRYFHGIPVSPGVEIGLVSVVANNNFLIRPRAIESTKVAAELAKLDSAFECAAEALERRRIDASEQLGEQYGQIFEAHALILRDAKLREKIEKTISEDRLCSEYAVYQAFNYYAKLLQGLQDAPYADRANDVVDVRDQLLRQLLAVNQEVALSSESGKILAANFLNPSDAAKLDPAKTIAIVTETGGLGSHTAIVASALGIPTVLGVGPFISELYEDDLAIVDGSAGLLIINPDPETVQRYQAKKDEQERRRRRRAALREKLVVRTSDGVEIEVKGNIEFPNEAAKCVENGAAGIGLYRTEFLFLTSPNNKIPDEETHFRAYKSVLETVGSEQSTIIRTFDLGADKTPGDKTFVDVKEPNPFMGLRSIRLSLRHTEMFRSQLRAILRASVYGKVKIMFPLVTTITEWRDARAIFMDVRDDLLEEGVPFDREIPLGVMVETPAIVVMLEQFAPEVDFFSIGTNDLLQYTQAVDRSNENVMSLYQQESPALLRFIRHTISVANHYGKPISLCGQMGSMPTCAPLLLGLGLRSLSVSPSMILQTKELCESFSMARCEEIARKAWRLETAADIRAYLRSQLRDVLGSDELE